MEISKAVVLAAGRGTRMKSLTADCPKPMLPIEGRPMLAHAIEALEAASVKDILVIVGYKAEMVEEYFAAHPPQRARLSYRLQTKQDGTGSAAKLSREFVGSGPFLLTFGDLLVAPATYQSMFQLMEGADAVLAVKKVDDPYQGAAVYVEGDRITHIIEKPPQGRSSTHWINAGIYCLQPGVFDELDRIPVSPRGEYEFTDAIHQMLKAGAYIRWHEIQGFWRDIGRPEDLTFAEEFIRSKTKET